MQNDFWSFEAAFTAALYCVQLQTAAALLGESLQPQGIGTLLNLTLSRAELEICYSTALFLSPDKRWSEPCCRSQAGFSPCLFTLSCTESFIWSHPPADVPLVPLTTGLLWFWLLSQGKAALPSLSVLSSFPCSAVAASASHIYCSSASASLLQPRGCCWQSSPGQQHRWARHGVGVCALRICPCHLLLEGLVAWPDCSGVTHQLGVTAPEMNCWGKVVVLSEGWTWTVAFDCDHCMVASSVLSSSVHTRWVPMRGCSSQRSNRSLCWQETQSQLMGLCAAVNSLIVSSSHSGKKHVRIMRTQKQSLTAGLGVSCSPCWCFVGTVSPYCPALQLWKASF